MKSFWPLRVSIALGVSLGVALALDAWPPLRGDFGWRWGYAVPEKAAQVWPSLLGVMLYGAGALWFMGGGQRRGALVWAFIGAALLPYLLLLRWGDPFFLQFTRVASGTTSGPHLIASIYNPETIDERLRNWTDEQKFFADSDTSIHAALAPPGLPLLYYGANRILFNFPFISDPLGREYRLMQCANLTFAKESNAELASATLGMLSPVWAALAVLPLFWLGRRVLEDEEKARLAALFWPLVPGLAMFTPTPNTVFPTLCLLVMASLWRGLLMRSYGWSAFAGFLAGGALFLNISLVPLLLLCGLLALGYHFWLARYSDEPPHLWWSLAVGAAFGAGLCLPWLAWLAYGGETPFAMLSTAMNQHLELERPYLPWLVLHLWDYSLFLGAPLAFFSAYTALKTFAGWRPHLALSPLALWTLALTLTLLILNFSGTARGETGRVWQFFFPYSLLVGVGWLAHKGEGRWLLGGMAAFFLLLGLFIPTIDTHLPDPPQSPPPVSNPVINVSTDALFAGALHLNGYGDAGSNSEALVLDVRWTVKDWVDQPFYLAYTPVAPDGQAHQGAVVMQPFEGAYPTTCWRRGQEIIERVVVPLKVLPAEGGAGEWWVSISVHDYTTFEPQSVEIQGLLDQQIGIGPFRVE